MKGKKIIPFDLGVNSTCLVCKKRHCICGRDFEGNFVPTPIHQKGCRNVGWIKNADGEKVVVPLHVGTKCVFVTKNFIFEVNQ